MQQSRIDRNVGGRAVHVTVEVVAHIHDVDGDCGEIATTATRVGQANKQRVVTTLNYTCVGDERYFEEYWLQKRYEMWLIIQIIIVSITL